MRPNCTKKQTHHKHHVALDKICRGNRCEGAIADDTARWWDKGKERLQNSLGLLQLVELDERVEEGHCDEDTTEIRILEAVLLLGEMWSERREKSERYLIINTE